MSEFLHMAGGFLTFCLILCTIGVIAGGAMWGISGASGNPYASLTGRKTVVLSLFGALVAAAASALVAFFVHIGSGIH